MAEITLKDQIVASLASYLGEDADTTMIGVLADRAIIAYDAYRNYPSHWTAEQKEADRANHVGCISDLALFEYIQQGAEYQSMHIESGLYRMWQKKGSIFTQHRVVPFATIV